MSSKQSSQKQLITILILLVARDGKWEMGEMSEVVRMHKLSVIR